MNSSIEKQNRPQLIPLTKGEQYKAYQVTGEAGMIMPQHISTKEAVVIIQEGAADLKINNSINHLEMNDVFVIPAGVRHSLAIKDRFKSIVIMENDSEIKFVK
ncbi:MAG: cupin [Ignavibacteriota bacterium]